MIGKIERALVHLLGWHAIGCRGRLVCAARPGQSARIVVRRFGWHRWVDRSTGGAR